LDGAVDDIKYHYIQYIYAADADEKVYRHIKKGSPFRKPKVSHEKI